MRNLRYAAVAALLVLSGCRVAGGTPAADGSPTAGGSARADAADQASPSAALTELTVNRSYWHQGFKVTVGTAKIVEGSHSPKAVVISATFENLSTEYDSHATTYALLTAGTRTYADVDNPLTELPDVPAQRSQPGAYAFAVDDDFVPADAVLVVGEAGVRQATVPLGRDAGLVALEPVPIPVKGKVTRQKSGSVFMSVTGGEVRADEPRVHGEAAAGMDYVRLNFSATNNSEAGFAWVFDRDLNLKLPDGTSIGTDGNCSRAQILPDPHSTAFGGMACFLVPSPAHGTYTLTWDTFTPGALKVTI